MTFDHILVCHPLRYVFFLLLTVAGSGVAQRSVVVWHEEFDVPGLPDSTRWTWDVGGEGWGNQERQFYTRARPANAWVDSGMLTITAHREDTASCWYGPCEFTSARLVSRGRAFWTYGKVEVRARIPSGRGTWAAIWMLPEASVHGNWPAGGEIDIMEAVGYEPHRVWATVHTRAYNHLQGTQRGASMVHPSIYDSFHIYGLEWTPDSLRMTFDGTPYFTFLNEGNVDAWPFDQPFHLLLNLAIGGTWGGAQGIDTAIFPARYSIDWVRVSKIDPGNGPWIVTIDSTEGGTVQAPGGLGPFAFLDSIELHAHPAPGWRFRRWSGSWAGTDSVLRATVEGPSHIRAIFEPRGRPISNNDFAQGWRGWSTWNDAAVRTDTAIRDGAACLVPRVAGAQSWHSQLQWTGLSLVRGERWTLRFRARAAAPRNINVGLVMNHEPFGQLANSRTLALDTTWSDFQILFTATATNANARLEFGFGDEAVEVCLDDIELLSEEALAIRPIQRSTLTLPNSPAVDALGRPAVIQFPRAVPLR